MDKDEDVLGLGNWSMERVKVPGTGRNRILSTRWTGVRSEHGVTI